MRMQLLLRCGELWPGAAMCRQREHLARTLRSPGPGQGRPGVRVAPQLPHTRLRGAAALLAPVPRRRPSGGGWRGPASRRSCPGTTPAGGRGWAQGRGDTRHAAPRCPAHLATREQPVVEVADTVAEAELGHTVVDQQEVPQLGSRRGSHRAKPVRNPRNPPGAPACPQPARDARVRSRTRRFSCEPGTSRSHTRSPPGHTGTHHHTDSPGTTHTGLAAHRAPHPWPRRSRCGAAAGARPPGPWRARARARSLRARRDQPPSSHQRHFRRAQR